MGFVSRFDILLYILLYFPVNCTRGNGFDILLRCRDRHIRKIPRGKTDLIFCYIDDMHMERAKSGNDWLGNKLYCRKEKGN